MICLHKIEAYLLNLVVYANEEVSPNPPPNDVKTIPTNAIHSASAVATTANPIAVNTHASVTYKL